MTRHSWTVESEGIGHSLHHFFGSDDRPSVVVVHRLGVGSVWPGLRSETRCRVVGVDPVLYGRDLRPRAPSDPSPLSRTRGPVTSGVESTGDPGSSLTLPPPRVLSSASGPHGLQEPDGDERADGERTPLSKDRKTDCRATLVSTPPVLWSRERPCVCDRPTSTRVEGGSLRTLNPVRYPFVNTSRITYGLGHPPLSLLDLRG